jgi:hypothetical protein
MNRSNILVLCSVPLHVSADQHSCVCQLTVSLLIPYIHGSPSEVRNLTSYIYIYIYIYMDEIFTGDFAS